MTGIVVEAWEGRRSAARSRRGKGVAQPRQGAGFGGVAGDPGAVHETIEFLDGRGDPDILRIIDENDD